MSDGRILVTGATGFVGRAVVSDLSRRGCGTTIATRTEAAAGSFGRAVTVGQIDRDTDWRAALEGVCAVVHLAGHVHVAPERATREAALFDEVNHLGSLTLYRQAAEAGIGLFVFVSSVTVLGTGTSLGAPFDDRSAPHPSTPYASSKLAAERALAQAAGTGGPTLVILRPPLVVGAGVGGNLRRLIRLAALPGPLALGRIPNRRTLLSLDDLVSAVGAVLSGGTTAPPGTYLLGDATPLSTSDILRSIREGLGRRPMLLPCPAERAARILALLRRGGLAERLFGSLEIDASRFAATFGWTPVTDAATSLAEAARAWRTGGRV